MKSVAIAMLLLPSPVAAATLVQTIDKSSLDCSVGAFGESCLMEFNAAFPAFFAPPAGHARTTLRTEATIIHLSADFDTRYRWRFRADDGSIDLGNDSLGPGGSLNSFGSSFGGFNSGLAVSPFQISFISRIPATTDRCANLFASFGATGFSCSEHFLGVETIQATLSFLNPPDHFTLTSITSAVPEPQTWLMLLAGFGIIGVAARRRRLAVH